jgi:alkanesulfonate monooxygenase SsuD/methylene tetrahydromethanopterin reductase-like flavin-dependent oxidoreductase (luciferase family)
VHRRIDGCPFKRRGDKAGVHARRTGGLFGIGCGWNAEEMEDHGTVYETRTLKMREQIEAMKEIWTKDVAEYHGQIVDFPPMNSWRKPVQKPHPPIIVGGAFRLAARRALRYYRQRRARVPAARKSSCRAGAKWSKRPAGTRARCR